jgi:hypothetical protein
VEGGGGEGAVLVMKLSKWHCAIAVRSLLRDARALFRCGSRPEADARCLSRNTAIGLKTTWASVARLMAALEDLRRATCKGPPVLHLDAILLAARLDALLYMTAGMVCSRSFLQPDRDWGQP